MKIDQTKVFESCSPLVQSLIMKRVNRIQIEEEIIICRNVGISQWKGQSPIQERWKAIVIEIIESEDLQECIGCSKMVNYEDMLQDDGENDYCKKCFKEMMPLIIKETREAEAEMELLDSKLNSINVNDPEII